MLSNVSVWWWSDPDVGMNEGIDDSDYTFTPEKSCSNKSMGELNEDWAPLGKDLKLQ